MVRIISLNIFFFSSSYLWCLHPELQCCCNHGLKHFPQVLCHFKCSLNIKTNENQEVSNCPAFHFVNKMRRVKMKGLKFLKVKAIATWMLQRWLENENERLKKKKKKNCYKAQHLKHFLGPWFQLNLKRNLWWLHSS